MFCASCGSANADNALFCASCGAAMKSGPPPPASARPSPVAAYEASSLPKEIVAPPLSPAAARAPVAAPPAPAVHVTPAAPLLYATPVASVVPAAPVAPVAPAVSAAPWSGPDRIVAGYRVAALGDRLIALLLDTALIGALFAVVGMWAGNQWGGVSPTTVDVKGTGFLVSAGIVAVVGFIYYWLCEGLLGMTLGKAIAGVRIIGDAGAPCGLGASLIRNILRIIDGLFGYLVGYFIAVFSRMRQRLGDHLSHTYVVERELKTLYKALMIVLWVVLVAAGFTGGYFIHGG